MKYKAFISYSHSADDVLAPALQSALHAFAKPWSSMRALHVFRDRTSLAASPELWPAIESALSESAFLLLMASPASAASHWVGREIAWWFANRPAGTMFILLTDGELVWDQQANDFDWSRTTCLPRELLANRLPGEPLWVDLRWAKREAMSLRNPRFREVVLDLASPLHGKDKDALDGEDVRQFARLQRVRRGVIAGLATLTLASAAAAWIAVSQRNEATRQNVIAQAGRLAAQSNLLLESATESDLSAMLATEAIAMLDAIGERSAEVDLTLRRALAGLPEERGSVELNLPIPALSPDGTVLSEGNTLSEARAIQVPNGGQIGCRYEDIKDPVKGDTSRAGREVKALSRDAAWCVVIQSNTRDSVLVERWTSSPIRRVDQRRVSVREGALNPFISDDGDLLVLERYVGSGVRKNVPLEVRRISADAVVLRLMGEEFLGFSPDHRHFATTTGLWRIAADARGAAVRVVRWNGDAWKAIFSRSGAFVVVEGEGLFGIWDVHHGRNIRSTSPASSTVLAIRDDGRFILTQGSDSTRILDALTDSLVAAVRVGAEVASFATRDPTLIVEDTAATMLTRFYRVLRMLASGAALNSTELPPGATAHTISLHDNVVDVLLSADSTTRLSRWVTDSGVWREIVSRRRASLLTVSADRRYFATSAANVITVGRVDGGGAPVDIALPATPSMIALSYNGRHLAALIGDTLRVRSVGSLPISRIPLPSLPSAIHVSDDGTRATALFVGDAVSRAGPEYTLTQWALAAPTKPTSMPLGRRLQTLESTCMLSGDARFVSVNGERRNFGAVAKSTDTAGVALDECENAFRSSSRLRIGGSRVVVTDTATGAEVTIEALTQVLHATASADGRRLATIDSLGGVRLFALDAKSLVAQVCARNPRQLSSSEWQSYMNAFTSASARRTRTVDACGRPVTKPVP